MAGDRGSGEESTMAVDPKPVASGNGRSHWNHDEKIKVVGEDDVPESTSFVEQEIVSSDDEVDYSIKPEFYDSDLDEKDEKWVQQRRKGRTSDALLSCPACFTTLCLDCQRHEKYVTQYRAMFVLNCEVKMNEVLRQGAMRQMRPRSRGARDGDPENPGGGGEIFRPVCCSVCSTEVGVLDGDQVYHLFNVLPSYS